MAFYKRSTFLINSDFQLKFSVVVSGIVFTSSIFYPLIFLDFMDEMVRHNDFNSVIEARHDLLYFIVPVQMLFTFVIFIFMIFLTHKIAGPVYKLTQHLKKIREGAPITGIKFRNGDHFHNLAEEVSGFMEYVAANQEKDFQYLDEVSTYLNNLSSVIPEDKKPVLNEIARRLDEIKSRYQKQL